MQCMLLGWESDASEGNQGHTEGQPKNDPCNKCNVCFARWFYWSVKSDGLLGSNSCFLFLCIFFDVERLIRFGRRIPGGARLFTKVPRPPPLFLDKPEVCTMHCLGCGNLNENS